MSMFCRQCEQTVSGKGCEIKGVCGKTDETANLQDELVLLLKGISIYVTKLNARDKGIDKFVIEALFTTVTNVDFNPDNIGGIIEKGKKIVEKLKKLSMKKEGKDIGAFLGSEAGLLAGDVNEDIRSLREILLYGLKGMAAYADHALILGEENEEVTEAFYKGLYALTDDTLGVEELIGIIMDFGKANFKCMEILDTAHTNTFGHPVPTQVSLGVKKGAAILVSGHDLLDLKLLLEQTKDKGINIYTHGEMLPAHGYPELNKYKHLVGHYGGAWQNQKKEFNEFPGAILMTTNCIQEPLSEYKDRIFTTGLVSFPGVSHIDENKDFSLVINKATEKVGFREDIEGKSILVGFAHNAVLGVAEKVVGLVKEGKIKHFFLIGGCDGAKPGRNYYTEFAEKVPSDSIILTLACGKFRFNKLEFGDIEGIPRLLDCGQCNDAYSAIKIAITLAEAFETSVNDLPLSLILSWYEQKAVCILLTLLSLGIKNIKIGPSLPAFITPNVLNVLVENFNLAPIKTPDEDLKEILEL